MSVYTLVEQPQLEIFLKDYALGDLLNYSGIAQGVENTNYALTTTYGAFILTLFEQFSAADIGYFLNLLARLRQENILCPEPIADQQGQVLKFLAGKSAVIFGRLSGCSPESPSVMQCIELGKQLSSLHVKMQFYPAQAQAESIFEKCCEHYQRLKPVLNATDSALIAAELNFQRSFAYHRLPQGLIHGDLFRDNVLFVEDKLSGLLDFYNANRDCLLLDIAITVNDWCVKDGAIHPKKLKGLLDGYQAVRPLDTAEKEAWHCALRLTGLRFFLARLILQQSTVHSSLTVSKDPLIYKKLLLYHQQHSQSLFI